jgi:DNA-directed RNA polymerase subunit F
MILERQPVSMAEAKVIVDKLEEKKELKDYFKKFTQLKADKAKKLAEDLRGLKNVKIKEENIVKVVDLGPIDAEDLNKIFTEVSLSEEETNAILEIVNK